MWAHWAPFVGQRGIHPHCGGSKCQPHLAWVVRLRGPFGDGISSSERASLSTYLSTAGRLQVSSWGRKACCDWGYRPYIKPVAINAVTNQIKHVLDTDILPCKPSSPPKTLWEKQHSITIIQYKPIALGIENDFHPTVLIQFWGEGGRTVQLLIGFIIVKIRANANFSEGTGNLNSSVLV